METKSYIRYSRHVAMNASTALREKKLTQKDLAGMLDCTQQCVSHILSGKANLTLGTISRLDEVLGTHFIKDAVSGYSAHCMHESILQDNPLDNTGIDINSTLPTRTSSGIVSARFNTGDSPFVVMCDDTVNYLCKASRIGEKCSGLARDMIGTSFANIWGICDLEMALVRLKPIHSDRKEQNEDYARPCFGRKWIDHATEIKDSCHKYLSGSPAIKEQLLRIATFDLWICNEDRLNNNLNLLYSFASEKIIAIDHAGIFNTSFSVPLIQLSMYDSMLYSSLFQEICTEYGVSDEDLRKNEMFCREKMGLCQNSMEVIRRRIPGSWGINDRDYESLISFISSERWKQQTFSNLNEIIRQIKG